MHRKKQARAQGTEGEVGAFEPNYDGSPIVWGSDKAKPTALGRHCHKARPGHHLSPLALADGTNVYDHLGGGFTLLDFGAPSDDVTAFGQAARELGVPFNTVPAVSSSTRSAYEAKLILVRPDQYVAWAGDSLTGPAASILGIAIGQKD